MKKITLKKHHAFTMIELVFVIVVVGILSAILVPRMQSSRLFEAADQITSHIRYTQHLAMMDDKFDPRDIAAGGDNRWFRSRWQILFAQDGNANNNWVYTIFSDDGAYNGTPDLNEIATNPQDTSKRLTGMRTGAFTNVFTKTLNLSREYDINGIVFDANCNAGGATRIAFDYLGRPMGGNIAVDNTPYPANRLITTLCTITLTNSANEQVRITIQPETGFVGVIY
jgi:prepilin-type N-terminal cleavage/methylation domain-containing protein